MRKLEKVSFFIASEKFEQVLKTYSALQCLDRFSQMIFSKLDKETSEVIWLALQELEEFQEDEGRLYPLTLALMKSLLDLPLTFFERSTLSR